jgi:hypothetical protein
MSTSENLRVKEEFLEYNHRGKDDEEQSQCGDEDDGNAITEICKIFMPKETGVKTVHRKARGNHGRPFKSELGGVYNKQRRNRRRTALYGARALCQV